MGEGQLPDDQRSKLDSIVSQMVANKESDDNIQAVVNDFKYKYSGPPTMAQAWNQGVDPQKAQIVSDAKNTVNQALNTKQANAAIDKAAQDAFRQRNAPTFVDQHSESQPIQRPDVKMLPQDLQANRDVFKEVTSPLSPVGKKIINQSKDISGDNTYSNPLNAAGYAAHRGVAFNQNTYDKINRGEYGYDFEKDRPTVELGPIDAFVNGIKEHQLNTNKADFLMTATKEQIIQGEEAARSQGAPENPDTPIETSKGWAAPLGNMVGQNAVGISKAIIVGAIGTAAEAFTGGAATPFLGPALGALFMSHDAGKQAFAGTFTDAYHDLRNKGFAPDDAYEEAMEQGKFNGASAALQTGLMSYAGINAGQKPLFGSVYGKGLKTFMSSLGDNVMPAIRNLAPELGKQTALAGGFKALENINAGKPVGDDVVNSMAGAGMLIGTLHLLGAASESLTPRAKTIAINGLADANPDLIDQGINQLQVQKSLTKEEADKLRADLQTQRELNKGLPDNVPEENKQKIQNLIDKRTVLENQIDPEHPDFVDKAYHPDIKEQINGVKKEKADGTTEGKDGINEKIRQLSEPVKSDEELKVFAEPGVDVSKLPDVQQQMYKQDPEGFLKYIADQVHSGNRDEVESGPGMTKTLVDMAVEKYPEHILSSPKIQSNGEDNQASETSQGGQRPLNSGGEAESPIPVKFNDDIGTLNYGDHEGEKETKESKAQIKQEILDDVPLGKTGDKISDFAKKSVGAWKSVLENEPDHTSVVTSSSSIKALNVWDGMGRPDPSTMDMGRFIKDFTKEEADDTGSVQTIKGSNGDIHVVRHGDTEDTAAGKSRRTSTPLTAKGHEEAADAGKELAAKGDIPQIITPQKTLRTVETTKDIINQLKPKANGSTTEIPAGISSPESNRTTESGPGPQEAVNASIPVDEKNEKVNSVQDGGGSVHGPNDGEHATSQEGADDVTSTKNDITRLRREQNGLGAEKSHEERPFEKTLSEARLKIDQGYDPQDLVNELRRKPRPISDVENDVLLHYQNDKEIALRSTNAVINKAAEAGDDAAVQEAKIRRSRLLDELQDIYDVGKVAGTKTAQGLAARAKMIDSKYSLANMMAEKRAANDGKPLTDDQQSEIEKHHEAISKANEELKDKVASLESENTKLKEGKISKSIALKGKELADKIRLLKINKGGTAQANIASIPVAIYDGAISAVALAVEDGAKLADAISKGIEHIKANGGFGKPEDEKAFADHFAGIDQPVEKKGAKTILLDKDVFKLQANAERARNAYDQSILKDEAKNKTRAQKIQDAFIGWERMGKLSNPLTMGKLAVAGLTRLATDPVEQAIGGVWSTLIPKIANGAIGEGGGLNVKAQAKAMRVGLVEGMKDASDLLSKKSGGKSDLDLVFGKSGQLAPEALQFFGQLHSATKAPIKRAIFERALETRLRNNIRLGADIKDPAVQTEIMNGAYKDANRAIFMQDNKLSDAYQAGIRSLENNKMTGLATGLQWLLPFVKVPTNIAGEIGTNVAGLPIAAAKIARAALGKGLENLSADEKDVVMRNLKKGSIGAGAMLLGYFNPGTFGGFYQEREKRKEGDAKAGTMKILGVNVPAWSVEFPLFQAMQIGATVRRVSDTMIKGKPQGLTSGIVAASLGLADKIPFVDQPIRIAKAFTEPKERGYFMGELAKSTIDPAILSYMASATDPADRGSVLGKALNPENKRAPATLLQHIESGVPVLREKVPLKGAGKKPKQTLSKHYVN